MSNEKHKIDPAKAHQAMRRIKQQHIDIFNFAKSVQSDGIENLYNAWSTPTGKAAVGALKEGLNSCMSGEKHGDTVNKVYNWLMVKLNTLITEYCKPEGISYSTVSPESYGYPFKEEKAKIDNNYDGVLINSSLKKVRKLYNNIEKNMNDTITILTSGDFGLEGTEILDVANTLKSKMKAVLGRVDEKINACVNTLNSRSDTVKESVEAARKNAKSN